MSKQYKRFEAHGLFMHRLAIASACLGKKKSENKSIPYNSARGGKKKCRDVRRLASMAAECVDLVNLDMAALTAENSTLWLCQTILVPDVAKTKILPHKTCSNGNVLLHLSASSRSETKR